VDAKKKMSCDVLVVGGGNAGLVAAIEAKNRGVKVLLIEKSPKQTRGGNSRHSWGTFRVAIESEKDYLPLLEGTKLPKGKIEVGPFPKDEFYSVAMRLSDGLAEKRLTEIYVNQSLETVQWMKEQGFQWDVSLRHAFRDGDRLIWPTGTIFLTSLGNSGEGLVEQLYDIAEKRGIEIFYETAAYSLVMNVDNKVCGAMAKSSDGIIQIDAKNVILASGGFQADPSLRRSYFGENWDLCKVRGTRYDTGDGIKMGIEIGAQVSGHWGGCHATVVSEDSPNIEGALVGSERYSYPFSIIVNRNGERFFDEGETFWDYTYAKLGKEIIKQPGCVAFQIFDAKVFHLFRDEYKNALMVESNSLKELAEDLDINVERFLATVQEFNKAIINNDKPFIPFELDGRRTKGLNPDKSNWAQTIDTPPYRAYAVACGLTMTYGGLKTNEKAQVLDTSDNPIKGLYAIGEMTGGFFYHNYPGGAGLIRGAVMGRIAGAEAASNI
jgi:tricarballylate dehydrogenase